MAAPSTPRSATRADKHLFLFGVASIVISSSLIIFGGVWYLVSPAIGRGGLFACMIGGCPDNDFVAANTALNAGQSLTLLVIAMLCTTPRARRGGPLEFAGDF